MDKVYKPRRKRCYECKELFNDDEINIAYNFKDLKAKNEWDKIKYDTNRNIMEFLDPKTKHYLCEDCYDFYI